jgi:hypothetical protein
LLRKRDARGARPIKIRRGLALAAAVLTIPSLGHAAAIDSYYERAVMSAANQRCGLFSAPLAAALGAAEQQARGAALRSGFNSAALGQVGQRARDQAARTACNSPDLAVAANRVRVAFDGYAKLYQMTFAGDAASWKADRATSAEIRRWRLFQPSKFGWDTMIFGLAGRSEPPQMFAVANFNDGAIPYAARLVVRDTARASDPFLNALRAGSGGRIAMGDRMPPRSATRSILAEARGAPNAELYPAGAQSAVAFRFPAWAMDTLANLDPREVVAVDFLFASRGGETVRTAYVEVGDFAAGRAFLAAGQR